jgi:hypothetical protein
VYVETFKPDDCQPGLVCILADHKLTSERRTSPWRTRNTRNLCHVKFSSSDTGASALG